MSKNQLFNKINLFCGGIVVLCGCQTLLSFNEFLSNREEYNIRQAKIHYWKTGKKLEKYEYIDYEEDDKNEEADKKKRSMLKY